MKKIIAIAALVAATSASAGFFNDNTSWSNGYQEDNGIFDFNPYSFWEPRWYIQEANNFMNEVDEDGRYVAKTNHGFPVSTPSAMNYR
jgi:hypothetical protein